MFRAFTGVALAALIVLVACTDQITENVAPIAVLDAPASVPYGSEISLVGSRSVDTDGEVVTYQWTKVSGAGGSLPAGSTVETTDPALTVASPTDDPLEVGTHSFRLVVMDGSGNASAPHEVDVQVIDDQPPTAVVDAPSSAPYGTDIVLDASGSVDTGGEIVTYQWTKASGAGGSLPADSTVETTDPALTVTSPTDDPLELGTHTFRLVVVDGSGNASAPDEVDVHVIDDQAPTAVLRAPSSVPYGSDLSLDGRQSVDIGGGIVTYRWTKVSGAGGSLPAGSMVETTDPALTVTSPTGDPLEVGTHSFRLVVVDGSGNASAPHEVDVQVIDDQPPTAVVDAPSSAPYGTDIVLDASGSVDTGGEIVTYQWTKASGAGGSLPADSMVETTDPALTVTSPTGDPLEVGTHTFQLVVVDGSGNASAPDEVDVHVIDDQAPTAVLRAPSSVPYGSDLSLDGRQSVDIGGDIVTYRWTKVSGAGGSLPAGSMVETIDPILRVTSPAEDPLEVGTHTFRLVVVDGSGNASAPDEVDVHVIDDQAPTAVLRAPSSVPYGSDLSLDGRQSVDTGGGIVTYRWKKVSGAGGSLPAGSMVETTDPLFTVTSPPDNPLEVGTHTFRLVVVDGSGNASAPDEVDVHVIDDQAPTAVLRAPSSVPYGSDLSLDGRQSVDTGGDIVAYRWTKVSGAGGSLPAGSMVETIDPILRVTSPAEDPLEVGTHTFRLVVLDGSGNASAPDEVDVHVIDDQAPTAVLRAPSSVPYGSDLSLDGRQSVDAGGGIVAYRWTKVSGVGGSLPAGSMVETIDPLFTVTSPPDNPLEVGTHTFRLVVVDGSGNASAPDEVDVHVIDDGA